jgi:lipoprotein-releasing system ATP-binding protein
MNDAARPRAAAPALVCRGITRHFREGPARIEVLKGIDLAIGSGERIAIVGASGAGKSTLLQILGGLDRPSAGSVHVLDQDINALDEIGRGRLRNRAIGFVYQFHHLLPEFTALENVAMPLLVARVATATARERAAALLARVGLAERLTHKPAELSGGERQRAAVARALITRPALVLADEPTGNLDKRTGDRVFDLMLELNAELGTSLVVVTHDPGIAGRMARVLALADGRLEEAPATAQRAAGGAGGQAGPV